MTAVTCRSCGVAVTPGYVRCPKCHASLPASRRPTQPTPGGGTAVPSRAGVPILPIVLGVVAVAAIAGTIAWRLHDRSSSPSAPAASAATSEKPATPTPIAPQTAPPSANEPAATPAPPNADAVARALDRSLKRARLWSTVTVVGARLDIRSSSCGDANLPRVVQEARAELREAGIAKVRCLEMSGKIAFERDL
jgi:hypothetical protein